MNETIVWMLRTFIFIIFFVLHWYGSIATHSILLHRYVTHKQFEISKHNLKVLHFLYWIFNGACYLSPLGYAIMHTLHHRLADTEKDPHSPRYYSNPITFMLHTWKEYNDANNGKMDTILEMYTGKKSHTFTMWHELDFIAQLRFSRILWILLYAYLYYLIFPSWVVFLFAPFFLITCFMGPLHGFIVNWFAHKSGYRNFNTDDDSRNVLRHDWLLLGELLHNNHHFYKDSYLFAVRYEHETDPLGNFLEWLAHKKIVTLPGF